MSSSSFSHRARASFIRSGSDSILAASAYAGNELRRVEPLLRAGAHRERLVLWCRSTAWRAEYLYCDDAHAEDDA